MIMLRDNSKSNAISQTKSNSKEENPKIKIVLN